MSFDNVTFAYDGVRQILRGVSFDVQPGELIGLVGPSGGGKSTVVNLIARFYDVTGGSIRIDGVDVRELDTGHYREQLGMVLQDPYLFHGTVLDNIRYGVAECVVRRGGGGGEGGERARLHLQAAARGTTRWSASGDTRCRAVSVSGSRSRERFCTIRGSSFSTRRRAASTRRRSEQIQEALERLIAGRTVFAIAHRLSTLRKASRLFVIEQGRLAESGTHRELLGKPDGIYRKLYELQLQLQ